MAEAPKSSTILDLWPDQDLGAVFLTSYTLDPVWFELQFLQILIERGATSIALLVDSHVGYRAAVDAVTSLRGAGEQYHLIPVRCQPSAFHPKVHLFAGAGVALVGSGNFTRSGLGGNLEVFERLDAETEPTALGGVIEFVRSLLTDSRALVSAAEQSYLLRRLGPTTGSKGGDAQFLHSLKEPLFPQLEAQLLLDGLDELLLAAPFHDRDHRTTKDLAKLLGAKKKRRLAAQSGHGVSPIKGFKTAELHDEDGEGRRRRLHGKLLVGSSESGALVLTGSANLTGAAWRGRNVEAVVLRQTDDRTVAKFLDEATLTKVKFEVSDDEEEEPEPALPEVQVGSVTLHTRLLEVEMPTLASSPCFTLVHRRGTTEPLAFETSPTGYRGRLDDVPPGVLVLRVTTEGGREGRGLVTRTDHLLGSKGILRLRAQIRSVRSGTTDDEIATEVLQLLNKTIQLLTDGGPPEGQKGVSTDGSSSAGGPAEGEGDLPIDEVEVLLTAPVGMVWTPKRSRRALLGFIDSLTRPQTVDPTAASRSVSWGWTPDPAAGLGGVVEPKADDLDELELEDDLSSTQAQLIDIATGWADHLARLREAGIALAADIHESVAIGLARSVQKHPPGAREVLPVLLDWLVAGYGVADWPSTDLGVFAGDTELPRAGLRNLVLWATRAAMDADADHRRSMDRGRRVLLTLERAESGEESSWPSAPEDEVLASTLLHDHRTRGEEARGQIGPLWELEMSWRLSAKLGAQLPAKRHRANALRATCERYGPRSHQRLSAEEELGPLVADIAELEERLERAEQSHRECPGADRPLQVWEDGAEYERTVRAAWSRANRKRLGKIQKGRRVGAVDEDYRCPHCFMSPMNLRRWLRRSPGHVAYCPTMGCRLLLVSGGPGDG